MDFKTKALFTFAVIGVLFGAFALVVHTKHKSEEFAERCSTLGGEVVQIDRRKICLKPNSLIES